MKPYRSPEGDQGGAGGGKGNWLGTGLALASLGTGIASQGSNRREMRRQAQWNRDYMDHAYYRERDDALLDRAHMEFYNSPREQMKRIEAAGLNKALMYGQGSVGTTEMPRGAKPSGSSQPVHQIDPSSIQKALEAFVTIIKTQQETDNLRVQAELAEKQKENIQSTTDLNKFDLQQKTALSPNVMEASALGLANTKADIALKEQALKLNLDANERAMLANSANIEKTMEDINTMRQKRLFELTQQENIDHKAKAEIKKLEIEMEQLDAQIELLQIAKKYAEKDAQMKLLLQEFEAEIKAGGGNIGGVISKTISRLRQTLSPAEYAELKKKYPLLF